MYIKLEMNSDANERLNELKAQLLSLEEPNYPKEVWSDLESWIAYATPLIRRHWPPFLQDFQAVTRRRDRSNEASVRTTNRAFNEQQERIEWERERQDKLNVIRNLASFLDGLVSLAPELPDAAATNWVVLLCRRFHHFARQLHTRTRRRLPLTIEDEYDVQYLLHAILRLHFDDVRAEEWTPSYAGGSSRMDFLLQRERIVVEVKKTRNTLAADRDVADQLIIDIDRYSHHSACETLVCFVYDPDRYINNPVGLEADLSRSHNGLRVIVVISPQ
jgi:hypothetical protein